ncbi:MAG: ABC transporter C-terminal domain-containing protein, partial [Terracoccus sp.]
RVTDELLALDGNGGVRWVRGGVAAWLAQHAAAPARTAAAPPARAASVSTAAAPTSGAGRPASSSAGAQRSAVAGRSPSTVRRQLGAAARELATAVVARDEVAASLAAAAGHEQLTELSELLAVRQAKVDELEERWLSLASEGETLGLDL